MVHKSFAEFEALAKKVEAVEREMATSNGFEWGEEVREKEEKEQEERKEEEEEGKEEEEQQ
jgi:hypothetical protein